jgi:hypothetical protein
MPWKESTTMEQKIDPMAIGFICEWRTGKVQYHGIMSGL